MRTINGDLEQLPVCKDSHTLVYHFERDEGILQFTLYLSKSGQDSTTFIEWSASKGFQNQSGLVDHSICFTAAWLEWDDEAQDWIGTPVRAQDIMHLVPDQLYS
jgi:hypothetical protein